MIFDKINLGFPNIWVTTPDPIRAIDIITSSADRTFFTIKSQGFSQFVDGQWKPVLVPNPAIEEDEDAESFIITTHITLALKYLNDNKDIPKPTLIFFCPTDSCHWVQSSAHILEPSLEEYRKSFWSDDLDQMPLQILLVTTEELDPSYNYLFTSGSVDSPDINELSLIVNHINTQTDNVFSKNISVKEVAKAGLGFNEFDFIEACLTSIKSNGSIDPKYIYDKKMSNIKSHGILEIVNSKITFNEIGGLDNIKDIIKRTAVLRSNPQLTQDYGIIPIRRMLMVGIPGTGKSAICQATSVELGLDLARTGISQVMNKYIGQSEQNMRAVFQQIKAMNPVCVWIDEFGRDLSGSGQGADSGTTDRVHGEFLTGLQELPQESFLLCAANELHSLKPEMLRADRFDKIFFVGLPAQEERAHIFKVNLSDIKTSHEFDYDALAEASSFMTGAEIVTLIRETKFYVSTSENRHITTKDILNTLPKIKNTIWQKHPDMVKSMYEYALQQWDWASTAQMQEANILLGLNRKASAKVKFS